MKLWALLRGRSGAAARGARTRRQRGELGRRSAGRGKFRVLA